MVRPLASVLILAPLMAASVAGPMSEPNRVTDAAALFDTYCLNKQFTFANLDHRATEAHYEVVMDRTIPLQNSQGMRQKNWAVPSRTGAPVMLTSNDVTNGALHVLGCGIYAPDLDGKALELALSSLPRLGNPTKHTQAPEGAIVVWWNARVGDVPASDDSQVMLSRDIPSLPGVSVNLILKIYGKAAETK